MKIDCQWNQSGAFMRRMDAIRDLPRSRAYVQFRADCARIVKEGYRDRMLAGKDGRGRQFTPLAKSTLANKKRKAGPPLMPGGLMSDFWKKFDVRWDKSGEQTWNLLMGWSNFKTKKGQDIPTFHIEGKGRLPKRIASGIDPATWGKLKARWKSFLDTLSR